MTILTPVNNDEHVPKDSDLISIGKGAHMACSEEQDFKKRSQGKLGEEKHLTREVYKKII